MTPNESFAAWRLGVCVVCLIVIIFIFFFQYNFMENYLKREKKEARFTMSWMAVIVCVYFIFMAAFAAGMRSKNFPMTPFAYLIQETVGNGIGIGIGSALIPSKINEGVKEN